MISVIVMTPVIVTIFFGKTPGELSFIVTAPVPVVIAAVIPAIIRMAVIMIIYKIDIVQTNHDVGP